MFRLLESPASWVGGPVMALLCSFKKWLSEGGTHLKYIQIPSEHRFFKGGKIRCQWRPCPAKDRSS